MSKAEANQKPAAATPRLAEELNARVANEDKGTHNGVSGAGVTPRLVAAPKARVMDEGKGKNKSVLGAGATEPAPSTPLIPDMPAPGIPLIGLPLPSVGETFSIVKLQRELHWAFD